MNLLRTALDELEREHGDSFYLVDLDAFRTNYHEFLDAFRRHYARTNIAYSYKTNYTPKLCRMVNEWGGYAEVVSRMEYDLAQRLCVNPKQVIFNGPYKSANDIELALTRGSIVNVDWPYQIDIVNDVAGRFPDIGIRVGVRVTFGIPSSRPSRFGFSVEDGALERIFEQLGERTNVEIAGLHCHFLTPERSAADYRFITGQMLRLAARYFSGPPQFINLGGGYFSKMKEQLQTQFGIAVPTYGQYAEAIATQLAAYFPADTAPELILEPGISLTADVVKFAARVIDLQISGSRKLALVSGSIYDIKPTLNQRNLPIEVVRSEQRGQRSMSGRFDIVGFTCMEHDVLFSDFEGTLSAGDYVIFENVGAYTNVLRPPFIRGCAAMVGWSSQTGEFEVLKRRDCFDDVFSTYAF